MPELQQADAHIPEATWLCKISLPELSAMQKFLEDFHKENRWIVHSKTANHQNDEFEMKENPKQDLENCAFGIVDQYQKGVMVGRQDFGWQMTWNYLLKDLRTSCPGFSAIEYGIALNRALYAYTGLKSRNG